MSQPHPFVDPSGQPLTRRGFLRRLLAVGVGTPAAVALLHASGTALASSPSPARAAATPGPTPAPAVATPDSSVSQRDIGDKPPIKFEFSPDSDLRDIDRENAKKLVDGAKYKKDPPYVIGYSNASVSNSWAVLGQAHLDWELKRWGTDVIKEFKATDAQDKDEKQVADIEDLLSQNIDGLLIRPATAAAVNAVASRATKQGIPVVVYDRKLTTPDITCFLECNHYATGRKQTDYLLKALNGKGNIVALSGVAGAGPAIDRFQALEDALNSGKYPDIKLLDHQFTDWSPTKGKVVMQAMLQAYPEIDGVWADSGLQASGAIEAIQEAGRKLVPITGDDMNAYLKRCVANNIPFAGIANPLWQSAVALDLMVRILMGESVPSYISMKGADIYPENASQYVRPELPDDYWADVILPLDEIKKVLNVS